MKIKFFCIFVLSLLIISLQIVVFADMDAPHINSYQAIISNIDGATYYSYDWATRKFSEVGTLNYGDKIEISYEEYINNETYGGFYKNQEQYGEMYMVKTSNFDVFDESIVIPENFNKNNEKKAIVLKEDGISIYDGPAYGYEKLNAVIPKGEQITLYDDKNVGSPWYYTEYKDTSGWVCILEGSIGFDAWYENYEIMTYKDLKVYDDTTYTKVVGIIPANTKIKDFLEIDDWSMGKFVIYNNISGYVSNEEIATNSPWTEEISTYVVPYPSKLYEKGDLRSKVLEEIPEGTKLSFTISSNARYLEQFIYVTYNGKTGWVYNFDEAYFDENESYEEHLNKLLESYEEELVENEDIELDTSEESKENSIAELTEDITTQKNITGMQILMICIGLAIVISLTSFVTIVLVNKKNKKE